jgi:serine/threonine-protein kinase
MAAFEICQGRGNGEVWQATHDNSPSEEYAVKLLKKIDFVSYTRFRDEVKVLKENSDIKGLLQIIDYNLPQNVTGVTPWYVMPLATPLNVYMVEKSPEQIVDIILSVSKTLIELHGRGISHRDIKPANILVKDYEIYLSDFGLVEYPGKKDLTVKWKDVGARWTIAPEMKRNPDTADGKLADIYSIAKTLWILLTGIEKGFEGQYSVDSSVEIKKFVPSIYHISLDGLLHKSTDHEPANRPSIQEFAAQLEKWKELNKNFEKRSKSEWLHIQNRLFPYAEPKTVIWENIYEIITILNIISEYDQVNHTMLPGGGGLDLEGAKLANEEGCIEINFNGHAHVVKPKRLLFECFHEHSDWNYFRLETEELEPIGKHETERFDEGFTEIEPCVYSDYECYDFNDFNGETLPASARPVRRILKGSFIICLRTGVYNKVPGTYDGRHNKFSADDFRGYIERAIKVAGSRKDMSAAEVQKNAPQWKKPRFIKPTKIRKGSRTLNAEEIRLINKVISLSKEAKKESDELCQKIGLSGDFINFSDEKTIVAFSRYENLPKPKNEMFETFLESLSGKKLALIEAVMYGGRDASSKGRAYPLDEMLRNFEEDSKDSRIQSITEKKPLDLYLTKGVEAYK